MTTQDTTTADGVQAGDVRTPMRRLPNKPDVLVELTQEEAAREYQGEPIDPLEELLAYDSDKRFNDELDMSQYGFRAPWVIQNLTGPDHSQLIERSSRVVKNTGAGTLQKQMDGQKFQALVVAYGVKSPNHRDPKIMRKYGMRATQEDRLVLEIYKNQPGLMLYVSNAILELSGFHEDLVEVAKSAD
jgi:Phage XkdN-like tail assembly chaperone protein, TAC